MPGEWSKYRFITQIYAAKKDYYNNGSSKLTDPQYDALERSFVAIHGKEVYDKYILVGYEEGRYEEFKKKLDQIEGK